MFDCVLMRCVQAAAMNWGIAMFGFALLVGVVNYIVRGRKVYRGPVVDIKRE